MIHIKDLEKLRTQAAEEIIKKASDGNFGDRDSFFKLHKKVVEKYGITMLTNDELSKSYHNLIKKETIKPSRNLEKFIQLKKVRSLSGIVVVSVLTKPYACPGNCLYCPTQKGLPKSYMKNEPAVMRALSNGFDPYKQVQNRLLALKSTGHTLEKINIRIIGGTWSYYPKQYQSWFIKRCFQACNEFNGEIEKNPTLEQAQKKNENTKHRIVEISIETRQDYIDLNEVLRLRKLGVTKVELGVQSIYDDILKFNRRGHDVQKTIEATKILKDAGFKVAYQIMLNLPGSSRERDEKMLEQLFLDESYKPDYLKIYPLAIVKEAPVYQLYKRGKIHIYSKEELMSIISNFKKKCPSYLRIERIIRDIPSDKILEGGAKISNLRQIISEKMQKEGVTCNCIRCREIGSNYSGERDFHVFREDYKSSLEHEIFLTLESRDRKKLYCMVRLRISESKIRPRVLLGSGLIREIHTYGPQIGIGKQEPEGVQNRGLGKMLMQEAENITKNEFKLKRISVISGVGVRNFFRKIGYRLEKTYMVKDL